MGRWKNGIRAAWLAVALCLTVTAAQAATRQDVVNRLEYFRQFFVDFQYAPDSAIPGDLLANCHGVIIVRQYKAGFIFGAKGGDGVIFMHDRATGGWTGPAFVTMAEGSFGFQIGGQAIDAIILIMNETGVDMLLRSRFSIGVDASAAAGPVGRNVSAAVGPGTALLTYSRAKGLYAGASFEGGAMFNYDSYNRLFYGRDVTLKDIILNKQVHVPREAFPMMETLSSYAVGNTASIDPSGTPPPAVDNRTVLDREAAEAARRADMAAEEARRAAAAAEAAADRASRGY